MTVQRRIASLRLILTSQVRFLIGLATRLRPTQPIVAHLQQVGLLWMREHSLWILKIMTGVCAKGLRVSMPVRQMNV